MHHGFLLSFFLNAQLKYHIYSCISHIHKFFGLPGTTVFLSENPELLKIKMTPSDNEHEACNKDTGEKQKNPAEMVAWSFAVADTLIDGLIQCYVCDFFLYL